MADPKPTPTVIKVCAKCADFFTANLVDAKGAHLGEYQGYVPDFFPGEHYGDYVELDIELATGKILNWKKPSRRALKIFNQKSK